MTESSESKRRPWPGGYIHRQNDGRDLFIIEKRVRGKRFHVSTRAHSWTAAMKQLERFEADPLAYRPEGEEQEEPLYPELDLTLAFHRWMLDVKGTTTKHANAVKNYLAAWIEDFGRTDLRKVTLRDHIKPALDRRVTCRGYRIAALKAFYAWLRKERHLLSSAQDPTLDLAVPQASPEKWKRRKAVELERVQAALKHLGPLYRDLLVLAAATGWHTTEIERFIRNEDSEIVRIDRDRVLAVLITKHKSGEQTRTPILDHQALAAAERLRAHGKMPKGPNEEIRKACEKAGVEKFGLGKMRHTVGTWGVERGALPAQVAEFLGHKDPRTTRRFYIDVAVPTVSVPLPKLRLVRGKGG